MYKYLFLLAVALFLLSQTAFTQATFSGYMFGDYYYNVARDSSFDHKAPANSALSLGCSRRESNASFSVPPDLLHNGR